MAKTCLSTIYFHSMFCNIYLLVQNIMVQAPSCWKLAACNIVTTASENLKWKRGPSNKLVKKLIQQMRIWKGKWSCRNLGSLSFFQMQKRQFFFKKTPLICTAILDKIYALSFHFNLQSYIGMYFIPKILVARFLKKF